MSRYDGLIIPRSYSEYINKTDAATLLQALQLSGVMDNAPTANSNHPTKSSGVYTALAGKQATLTFDNTPTVNSDNPVKSKGIFDALNAIGTVEVIYNGVTFDNTVKPLTTSIRNYRFICIGLQTNVDFDYIFLPTVLVSNNTAYVRTMMGNATDVVTLPFAYQSTATVIFPSDTTVKCKSQYNNENWVLKLFAIWGVK